MKGCTFPEPYWRLVPFVNKQTGEKEVDEHPVLLPHEVLWWYIQKEANKITNWRATPATNVFAQAHQWCSTFEVDQMKFIPLGIHGDGVPFAAKMRDSLECISFNILTDVHGVRLLFTTFPKSRSARKETWDALFKALAWRMRHLMLGSFPRVREDGLDWTKKRSCQGSVQ